MFTLEVPEGVDYEDHINAYEVAMQGFTRCVARTLPPLEGTRNRLFQDFETEGLENLISLVLGG